MSVANPRQGGGYVDRAPGGGSSSLADVVELILDRGLVIDAFVRVSLVGIEILTIDARIVVASVDTYLRFAEATNRLDLYSKEKRGKDLPELAHALEEPPSVALLKGRGRYVCPVRLDAAASGDQEPLELESGDAAPLPGDAGTERLLAAPSVDARVRRSL